MSIIVLGILTGIDNFAVSAGFGTLHLGKLQRVLLVAAFAVCEAFMPVLGFYAIGAAALAPIEWLGPVLLIAAGALVAWQVYHGAMPESGRWTGSPYLLVLAPILLSLDNLAAGAALRALGGFDTASAVTAGGVAAMVSIAGLWLGSQASRRFAFRPQIALAVCLIAAGAFELAGEI